MLAIITLLGRSGRQQIDDMFSYFSMKIGFDISCKLSPKETICMQCQSLFSEKNKKIFHNVVCRLSTNLEHSVGLKPTDHILLTLLWKM